MKAIRFVIVLATLPAIAGCVATVPVERERVVVRERPAVVERPVVVERPAIVVRP